MKCLNQNKINPTVFKAAIPAFAKLKMTPTAPPHSGPRDLEIIKYSPPPLTSPFVLTADIDNVVIVVTTVETAMIIME